ncbi:MAG: amylo-alpha-1,6-glucosidase [bacterium]|nr:amylo-alpha-1,6-glucosidase [bacterium]
MNTDDLYQLAYQSILNLSTEEGIYASAREEAFGCVFGRDSAITILKILRAHSRKPLPYLLETCHKALLNLILLQGKEFNLESGEQPGKFIHEFRKDNHSHLTAPQNPLQKPWFIYPDGTMRNYDSLDSTPLSLIALYRYWQAISDNEFLINVLPSVEAGLNWIISFGDPDKDFLLEYDFPPTRQFGGLSVQSWTDSHQSILTPQGLLPQYPIAPVEVQAFAWMSLTLWAKFYQNQSPRFAQKLASFAEGMKQTFNKKFLLQDQGFYFAAQALDGQKQQIPTITANPLLCLWASDRDLGKTVSIIEEKILADFVTRGFLPDLFVEGAGIRTMSSFSPTFNPNPDSYHNGSFWPVLNGLVVEGLENFGFKKEAKKLKEASLLPIRHFGCSIELYNKTDSGYSEYCSPSGQVSCHTQAWSAASILDLAI